MTRDESMKQLMDDTRTDPIRRSQAMDEKELYFAKDTREHQLAVARILMGVAKQLLDRAIKHDESKMHEPERSGYIEPVYALNAEKVEYASARYKELCSQMGEAWKHHEANNDHHIGFFVPYSVQTLNDPIRCLDLICLLEMCCDWIAAAQRKGNDSVFALDAMCKKYSMDEQLAQIIRNTLATIESWMWGEPMHSGDE